MSKITDNILFVPCNTRNHGPVRSLAAIRYLVYHYTANDGDTDMNNAKYYRDNVVGASAHYFVDDDSITQSVQDDVAAWAVGGSKYASCPQTGGGKLHGFVTNSNSLSIEMCDMQRDGKIMSSEATQANAIELGKMLMRKYNIPVENVVRHFDVTGKLCPAWLVDNDKWAAFKARLVEQEENTVPRFDKISDMPDWARPTIEKLCDKHLLNGSGGERDENDRPADLDLSMDMLRIYVVNDRAGIYG